MLQGLGGIGAEAGVDFGGLDYRAAGSCQPAEAGGRVELAYGAGIFAWANSFYGVKVLLYLTDI